MPLFLDARTHLPKLGEAGDFAGAFADRAGSRLWGLKFVPSKGRYHNLP
jgi:hypothetical protein